RRALRAVVAGGGGPARGAAGARGRPGPPLVVRRAPAPPHDTALAAAALERGVKVQPLSWHAQRPGLPGLVLGYAASTPSDIREGIAVLGDLLR
ncbi:PLP-dependent aminotransferase family protein, partial [Streptomyces lasiicapitis]